MNKETVMKMQRTERTRFVIERRGLRPKKSRWLPIGKADRYQVARTIAEAAAEASFCVVRIRQIAA
jgi:hypothetical protein